MERLIKQDKYGHDRYIDIKVEDLKDGTADIVKTSGIVGSDKFSESRTNVKTGYEKALKRAQTMWNNEHTKCNQVLPMLANKWEDRKKYISEPFYVQPKLDGVRLLVSKDGVSRGLVRLYPEPKFSVKVSRKVNMSMVKRSIPISTLRNSRALSKLTP